MSRVLGQHQNVPITIESCQKCPLFLINLVQIHPHGMPQRNLEKQLAFGEADSWESLVINRIADNLDLLFDIRVQGNSFSHNQSS